MMYILTEEEYKQLQENRKREFNLTTKKLQTLCTKICNEMPVQWGWGQNKNDPEYFKPWGCILTPDKEDGDSEWYCDKCPVQDICPSKQKTYSQ